ncbi:MAG: response regulator receiver protein [uncultured bacterium]|nr:MAG: response regulator receiver protein [uncultured bacterium]
MTANPIPLVLVVESDSVQRDLIQLCLQRIGCEVSTTRNPEQIATIISKDHPSLLILDTFLPGSSGLEVINELNHKKLLKHTKVLLISAFGFSDIIQQAKDAGVQEFLIKPLNIEEFSARIKLMLKI